MSELVSNTYANLPLPDIFELRQIRENGYDAEYQEDPTGLALALGIPKVGLPIESVISPTALAKRIGLWGYLDLRTTNLAAAIIISDDRLATAIQRDVLDWSSHSQLTEFKSLRLEEEFMYGAVEAYAFMIDTFTQIKFMRSDCSTMEEFLAQERAEGRLPILNERSLDRLTAIMSGDIVSPLIDTRYRETTVRRSSDLPKYDLDKIVNRSNTMTGLLVDQANDIDECFDFTQDGSVLHAKARSAGFFTRGLPNAVELFLQSEEERVIRSIKAITE